jgi:hypothetical protein
MAVVLRTSWLVAAAAPFGIAAAAATTAHERTVRARVVRFQGRTRQMCSLFLYIA